MHGIRIACPIKIIAGICSMHIRPYSRVPAIFHFRVGLAYVGHVDVLRAWFNVQSCLKISRSVFTFRYLPATQSMAGVNWQWANIDGFSNVP